MNCKQAAVLLLSLMFSVGTLAASKWSGEWFEIEVILLSQLHDKTTQAEIFDEQAPLPQYQNSLDLLSRYLVPDIKSLKQLLPHCDAPDYPASLIEQASHLPELHPVLSLNDISQLALTNETDPFNDSKQTLNAGNVEQQTALANQESAPVDDFFDRVKPEFEKPETSVEDAPAPDINVSVQDSLTQATEPSVSDAITEQQLALVAEAKQAFSPMQFSYHQLTEPAADKLCIISEPAFNRLNPDQALYSYNGFTVDKMPRTIDGIEDLYSKQAYLVSKQSLKLGDIVSQLRRSKNFRPLLHLAWRQPVFDLPDATPVKLFAGDNLQAHFFKEQAKFLEQQQLAAEQEARLSDILMAQASTDINSAEINQPLSQQQRLSQAKQQYLEKLFANIEQVENSDTVIAQLKQPAITLNDMLAQQSAMVSGPTAPIQPWYLEGFLNVYLRGVYLNVAADFNIVNQSLTEQSSLALKPNTQVKTKAIRFEQHRRMISQEVHYFDHPYMGMIVQIRRHQRPESEAAENEDIQH